MGKLTTHVLDTAHGRPAAGVAVRLYAGETLLADVVTNADGRCDKPLLEGAAMKIGAYRLEFAMGDYFRPGDVSLPVPAFVDRVIVAFGIADDSAHYHVPLLASPFGYTTYRGS